MRTFETLVFHDTAIKDEVRLVNESGFVWLKALEITVDDDNVEVSRKVLHTMKHPCKVGETVLSLPVVQIDPEWIKREKEILGR